jgi:uncharacterized membrane protein YdjX (TVP38/TMEM64 family)
VFVFFLMALLPFFPDDLICFIAGLTKIRIRTLIIITFLGRLPTNIIYAFAGEGIANKNFNVVVIVMAVGLVCAGLAWWKRDAIESFAKGFSRSKQHDKH